MPQDVVADQQRSVPLSDGLLLAGLTGAGYWIAFRYEAAYLNAYGFPPQLVHVSLESTLAIVLLLSGGVWSFLWLGNFIGQIWPAHPALQEKATRLLLLLSLPLWQASHYGIRRSDLAFYIIILGFIIIFELIWPMLMFRDKGSLADRIVCDEIAEAPDRRRSIFGRFLGTFGPTVYSLVFFTLFGGHLAASAGDAKALTTKVYLVDLSDPNEIVVRMYSDQVLAVRIDPQTRSIIGLVVSPTDARREVRAQVIGPLQKAQLK